MTFLAGESGNPAGRPKNEYPAHRLARQHAAEAIERLLDWMRSDNPKASVSAAQAILDRALGKPPQGITLSGDEENPLRLKRVIEYVKTINGSGANKPNGTATDSAPGET